MTPFVAQATIASPFGPMLLRRTARGLAEVNFESARWPAKPLALPDEPDHAWFVQTRALLHAWPTLTRDPALPPLDPQGTPFQQSVWQLLLKIPRGTQTSYGAIAAQLGDANKSRAVGAAVGRNPIGILVPCHRVLGRDGSLTGFGGGLPLKRQLLACEGVAYKE
jgi:methylated-DNA-[protein]-cysteine S-methyltransferase